ncbi:MAG: hypothetical protein FWH20_06955 [Oscillospiraceae bacterium]|nr:hypothetical protein [Oscillospiraceae bacterium]
MKKFISLLITAAILTAIVAIMPLTVSASENSETTLAPPADADWSEEHENWWIAFKTLEHVDNLYYHFILYKDNEEIHSEFIRYTHIPDFTYTHGASEFIHESGDYYFKLAGVAEYNHNSESVMGEYAVSSTRTYTRPDGTMGHPTNLRWEVRDDKIRAVWDTPVNFKRYPDSRNDTYWFELYRVGMTRPHFRSWRFGVAWTELDANKGFNVGNGDYYFRVMALSGDVDSFPNSVFSANSPVFRFTDVVENIDELLNDLFNGVESGGIDIDDARDSLSDLNKFELAASMQNDAGVLGGIQNLEEIYTEEMGITVGATVAQSIADVLNPDDISIIGAGLNSTTPGANMNLQFSAPDVERHVDGNWYKNYVQFNIDLDGRNTLAGTLLDVPVQITMPIPAGVLAERFVILHYHANGTYDAIYPTIKGNMATFTVTRFSVFVFANEVDESEIIVVPPTGLGDYGGFAVVAVVLIGISAGLWVYSRRRKA